MLDTSKRLASDDVFSKLLPKLIMAKRNHGSIDSCLLLLR